MIKMGQTEDLQSGSELRPAASCARHAEGPEQAEAEQEGCAGLRNEDGAVVEEAPGHRIRHEQDVQRPV